MKIICYVNFFMLFIICLGFYSDYTSTIECNYYNTVKKVNCATFLKGKYRQTNCRIEFIDNTRQTIGIEALLPGDIIEKCEHSDFLRGKYTTSFRLKG